MRQKKIKIPTGTIIWIIVLVFSFILNVVSWLSPGFSDWYTDTVFPYVSVPLKWFSDLFPFSLGEWMLWAAVLWLLILVILLIMWGVHSLFRKMVSHDRNYAEATESFGCIVGRYGRATGWIANIVFLVMTLNCVILYHVTPLENSLKGYGTDYSIGELTDFRDFVVNRCDALAQVVPRDADGEVCYAGGYGAMAQKARDAVSAEAYVDGGSVPVLNRLSGRSVTPKPLLASGFVSQQYMQGYYFPFSMEANYNSVMKIMNVPFTMCHELSHTHGFIYEDEANLIGFLACIHCDDPVFQYSGWLGVLNYVNNSFYKNVDEETYRTHIAISEQVQIDNEFLSDEAWQKVEDNAVVSTETAKAATDVYLDSTLKANGVDSGKASYDHVVALLLEYYDGDWD